MYVSVNIDPEDVLDELDDGQLKRFGLQRIPSGDAHVEEIGPVTRDVNWPSLSAAIRRRDFDRAAQLLDAIALSQGHTLPPVALSCACGR